MPKLPHLFADVIKHAAVPDLLPNLCEARGVHNEMLVQIKLS